MAKRPRSSRIDTFIERLEGGDVQTRRSAALKLGKWNNIVAVKHLCIALQDSDRHVRGDAAKSLGNIGDASAVLPLVKLVESDTSVGAIRKGVRALGRIADPAAVPALLKVAARSKSGLDVSAREALDAIGITAISELCRALTSNEDPMHREAFAGIKRMYRRRMPAFGAFPGGLVIEAVMTSDGLRPHQRVMAIEAALSCRLLYRSPERLSADAAKLCERMAAQHGDEAMRRNASDVLSYVSLGRPATATDQPGFLLRAVTDCPTNSDGADTLGRALSESSSLAGIEYVSQPSPRWRRIVSKLRSRWFAN